MCVCERERDRDLTAQQIEKREKWGEIEERAREAERERGRESGGRGGGSEGVRDKERKREREGEGETAACFHALEASKLVSQPRSLSQ